MRDQAGKELVAVNTYHTVVSRDGKFWLVYIPEIDQHTQARSLAEVEPMARDLIALVRGVPPDSLDIERQVELSDSVHHHLELARKYAEDAAWYQAEAANEKRFAAREMRAEGMTVRDIGAALGISHQRAQQLITSYVVEVHLTGEGRLTAEAKVASAGDVSEKQPPS
jgi:hypothetical protein